MGFWISLVFQRLAEALMWTQSRSQLHVTHNSGPVHPTNNDWFNMKGCLSAGLAKIKQACFILFLIFLKMQLNY